MFSLCRTKKYFTLLLILAQTACAANAVKEGKESTFTICAEPDSLPLSQSSSRTGYEIEVAETIAKALGRKLEIKWVPQRDHSYFRQTLGNGQCEALMSVPTQMQNVTTTRPWYRTGFVFVSRSEDKLNLSSFDEPRLGHFKIAVPATGLGETPPALALTLRGLSQNLRPFSIYEPGLMITAVLQKEVDLAIMWGPFTAGLTPEQKLLLRVQPTPDKDARLDLAYDISIGVRKGNNSLKAALDQALKTESKTIAAILEKWHVPLRTL